MSTEFPQAWQMAAGEAGRFYSDIFLKHDVMFLGPGYYGPYDPKTYRNAVAEGWEGSGIIANIASFHDNVQPGQIVLMREGHYIKAIGVIAEGNYEWSETFDDIYGWELQHTRRVIWQEHLNRDLELIQTKGALFGSRKQIPTFTRVYDESILTPLQPLFSSFRTRPLKSLPDPLPAPMTIDEIGQELFARGLANDAVVKVIASIERQRRLLSWYQRFGSDSARPTEHEVVAHTVLPLLLALGWSEQLLAVEWRKIDLAAFWGTPTTEKNCVLVCEAKTRNHGLQGVREQAFNYIKDFKLNACQKVLLTDGGRFYLYTRASSNAAWSDQAVGYFNVEKIRTNHIAPPGTNAIDTIVALTPAAASRNTL
jgi:hypothetical protein